MRTKLMAQGYLDFGCESSDLKVIRERQEKHEQTDRILGENLGILTAVHRDLSRLSQSSRGRSSKYTSEEILRALIVMFVGGVTIEAQ